jgi:hypothetical protein
MPKATRFYFAVNRSDIERRGVTPLLEMLRYDHATVELDEGGVVVFASDRPATDARWQSFGLVVIFGQEDRGPNVDTHYIMRMAQASTGFRGA